MIVRIRLGSSLARLAPAPVLSLELPDGATVEDVYDRLAARLPELAPALAAATALLQGEHVERSRPLTGGQVLALLTPVAGG
jgi:molybdopterin converting factor small subunit